MDFYEAIKPRSTEITLAGEPRIIERARLGRFFRLGELYRKYQGALVKRSPLAIGHLLDYLVVSSSIPRKEWENCSPLEFADAFLRLIELNNIKIDLPIFSGSQKREEKIYEYTGRFIATWIARLARMYGWTSEYILENLFPEEAACYLQESRIQEFNEQEFIYGLSEVAYRYDKITKTSRYIPLKKPGWMLAPKEKVDEEAIKIPRKYIPQGVVVDVEKVYGKGELGSNRRGMDRDNAD